MHFCTLTNLTVTRASGFDSIQSTKIGYVIDIVIFLLLYYFTLNEIIIEIFFVILLYLVSTVEKSVFSIIFYTFWVVVYFANYITVSVFRIPTF